MDKPEIRSAIDALKHADKVTQTLYDITNSINTSDNLQTLYATIHRSLKQVMDVTNFFIAIADREKKTLHFPYHADEMDDDFGSIDDFTPESSLTGYVVEKQEPLMLKEKELRKRAEKGGVWGPLPVVWLGVPLKVKDRVIGVVAVQNYTDPDCYNQKDIDLLTSVSDQIALAIDKKRFEDELERSEAKFNKLFQTTPCWSLLANIQTGRIIDANQTFFETSGYTRREVIGKTGKEFGLYVHPDDREAALKEYNKNGRLHLFPIQFRFKNGMVRDCLWSAQPFEMDDELCWISAVLDITERKSAELEKQRAIRTAAEQEKHALVGRVAGKMAHDFNNVLGAIMGNTELALLDCEDGPLKETLELILGQTIRGRSLTKNLTAFAKTLEPRHEVFRINDTVDLAVNLLKKDLEGITIEKDCGSDIPDLIADPGMIEHAMVNLIQNSIHALSKTPAPAIRIRTYSEGNHICFKIEDNGCGIPEAHMAQIFEPGFSLKGGNDKTGSYHAKIKGTGYGMANVMRYVDRHKGGIYAESEPGKGTMFVIRLPVIRQKLTEFEKSQLAASGMVQGKRILLVEDEDAISSIQKQVLTQPPCSHSVDLARNGREALELFDKNVYDLVSLDYQLPGTVNGMDIYTRITSVHPDQPVLFVSGNIEFLESIHTLRRQPHTDYISKPCGNKEYVEAVNRLLNTVADLPSKH